MRRLKPGKSRRLIAQKIEKIPLRHHRDEGGRRFEEAQIADNQVLSCDAAGGLIDAVVRSLQKPLEHAEFGKNFHGRGVDCVPPEIAEEIGVLFQHEHFDSGSGEQQPGHHTGRPAADNHNIRGSRAGHGWFMHLAATNFKRWPQIASFTPTSPLGDAIVILGAAGIVIPLFARIRITPVIGFILVGMLVGPFGLGGMIGDHPWLAFVTISDATRARPVR